MRVLYSPSINYVIWHNGNMAVTSKIDHNLEHQYDVHAAPITIDDMRQSFTNKHVPDYEERNITLWKDLDQKGVLR